MDKKKETVTDKLVKADNAQQDAIEQAKLDMTTIPTLESIKNMPTNISPVETRLMTSEIKVEPYKYMDFTKVKQMTIRKNNVHGFYKQITHNLTIGAKALFLVCRDLKQASISLEQDEYEMLKKTLPISDSTISKYITIAESDVCKRLFIEGRLPDGWTTMYEIAKVEDQKVKDKILKNVSVTTTADDVKSMASKVVGNVKKAFTSLFNYTSLDKPKDFIKVAVESNKELGTIDPNALLIIKEKVEQAVASAIVDYKKELKSSDYNLDKTLIAQVVADETMIWKSRESIVRYFKKYKQELFSSRFIEKFNDLTGHQLTVGTK